MNIEYKRKWCPECNSYVRSEHQRQNNVFHLLMTIITGGLWIFVWFACTFSTTFAAWQCPQCGSKKLTGMAERTASGDMRLTGMLANEAKGLIAMVFILGIVVAILVIMTNH